ncbi:MAG: bifunctional methylenetetrahydrofolate dehydrogenase/methenyltetrahydrofolate cyclohydrolase FolD [Proteobacteria bacterium]|nr:bifunctional methylenetetrahydrofolate dehydrogenase/methenyltetrahydrofolate cyclohydrolase FolD [Pseudomonadota bacterium]
MTTTTTETTTKVIDGKAAAKALRAELATEVAELKELGVTPGLAVVLVGEDPASKVYVRNKARASEEVGIRSVQHILPETTTEAELLSLIGELNADSGIHGILVQLPLPIHINEATVIETISAEKDADGFHPYNMGRLLTGSPTLEPCTPLGVMHLLRSTGVETAGKDAIVIGRSNIVGKPVAVMLLKENATVTLCHSKTANLPEKIAEADIVVAAIGRAEMILGEWIKEGATVIDVGMNRKADGKLCGDVEYAEAFKRAAHITPVPGGVGPMTIAMLLKNTVSAARRIHKV